MHDRIFLRKYRVSAAEIITVGQSGNDPLAYKGAEIESGRKILVEIFPAASVEAATVDRLEAEAAAAKKLSHANIPALYDFGVEDDHPVYISEHFDGTIAERWVATYGPMPVGPVLNVASQVVGALEAAAFHQVVHPAINPENLLLVPGQTAEGEWPLIKVLHFAGCAPSPAKSGAPGTDRTGPSPYASPEQIKNGTIDFRSEMFSLGCSMWFLLTGTAPPPSLQKQPAKPGSVIADLSSLPMNVRALLGKMLSVNPEERPGSPFAFSKMLQACVVQRERQEAKARTSQANDSWAARAANPMGSHRIPKKPLAIGALLLAISAIAVSVLPEHFWHSQTVQSEKRIGVPIGLRNPSPTPAPAVAAADQTPFLPATRVDPVIAPPARIDLSRIAATSQVEIPTAPRESPKPRGSDIAAKKANKHEVRRAQPAEEEARRTEPAAPGEGPIDVARANALSAQQRSAAPTTDRRPADEPAAVKTPTLPSKRAVPSPKPSPKTRAQLPETTPKPTQQASERKNVPKHRSEGWDDTMSKPPP